MSGSSKSLSPSSPSSYSSQSSPSYSASSSSGGCSCCEDDTPLQVLVTLPEINGNTCDCSDIDGASALCEYQGIVDGMCLWRGFISAGWGSCTDPDGGAIVQYALDIAEDCDEIVTVNYTVLFFQGGAWNPLWQTLVWKKINSGPIDCYTSRTITYDSWLGSNLVCALPTDAATVVGV